MESTSLASKSSFVAWAFLSLAGSLLSAQIEPPAVEWEKTFGQGLGFSVQQTSDGGFIVSGRKKLSSGEFGAILIKTDEDGNEVWRKTFDEPWAGARSVQTSDGGYVLSGSDRVATYLLKTDAEGNPLWEGRFEGILGGALSKPPTAAMSW